MAQSHEFSTPPIRETGKALDAYDPEQYRIVRSSRVGDVVDFAPRPLNNYHNHPFGRPPQNLAAIIRSRGANYGVLTAGLVDFEKQEVRHGLVLSEIPEMLDQRSKAIGLVGERGLANDDFEVQQIQGRVFIANKSGEDLEVISQGEFVADLSDDDRLGFETGLHRPKEANEATAFGMLGTWLIPYEDAERLFGK